MFEYAELLPVGFYTFGANANTTNVPDSPSAGCIIKRTSSHISIILVAYGTGKYYCVEYGGNWRKWNKLVLDSDLGYIDCKVSTIANNRVSIPGAPSTNLGYIPVIVGHDTTSSVLDNVFYDAGEWRMYSSFTQLAVVRFYKYPL